MHVFIHVYEYYTAVQNKSLRFIIPWVYKKIRWNNNNYYTRYDTVLYIFIKFFYSFSNRFLRFTRVFTSNNHVFFVIRVHTRTYENVYGTSIASVCFFWIFRLFILFPIEKILFFSLIKRIDWIDTAVLDL